MLDQQRFEQKEHREAEVAKEVQAEKLRNQQEQSYWAVLRWGPLVGMFGGGDLGKFFADAILRLQTGADPVEVPEQLKQELEAFKESLAGGGATTPAPDPESANRTESDSIRVDPTGNSDGTESTSTACPGSDAKTHHLSPALSPAQGGGEGEESRGNAIQQPKAGMPVGGNPAEASGPAVAGQAGQPVGPSAPSIAPDRTESDRIRVDPTGKLVGSEGTGITCPGSEVEKSHLSPALSPAQSGGEGGELHVNAVQQPEAGGPVGGNPAEASGPAVAGQAGQPVGPSAPSIAPDRTESDRIRVDPTGKMAGSEGRGTTCVGSEMKTHHLSLALSLAQGGGEGEESRGNAIQQPKAGVPVGGNPAEAGGPAVDGKAGQAIGPSAPSIAPDRTESDRIRVDPTGKMAGSEGRGTTCVGSEMKTHHLSPALSPAQGGGEGEESRGNAIQQPKVGVPVGGNPAEASGPAIAGQPVGPSAPSIAPDRTESDLIRVDPTGKMVGSEGTGTTCVGSEMKTHHLSPALSPARSGGEGEGLRVNAVQAGSAATVDIGIHLNGGGISNPEKDGPRSEEEELDPSCVRPQGYGDTRDHYFFNHYRHMSWAQTEEAGKLPADHVKEYILKYLGDPMKRLEKIVKLGLGHEPTFDEPGTSRKSRQSRQRVVMNYPPGLDEGPAFAQKPWRAGPSSFKSFGAPGTRTRGNREEDWDD